MVCKTVIRRFESDCRLIFPVHQNQRKELIKRSSAFACVILATFLWSFGGILIKWVSWHPLAIAGMRSAISAVFLLFFIRKPRFTLSFAQLGGAVSLAATVILFVSATKLTTAANAVILQYTAPVYTALFGGWFLKEKTGWYDWVIITVVLGGMVLIFLERLSSGGYLGNILAVISGVVTAWLTLFLRKQKDSSPLESIILGNVLTALIGLPFMFGPRPSAAGWTGLILLGVFQLGLPFFLYTTAIKHVTALDAILVCTMEPVLNPVWVFLFLKETPGKWAILGGSVIIAAVGLRSFFSSRGKADT